MKKFGEVMKEIAICLLFVILAMAINVLAFKGVYFKTLDVPNANSYDGIDRSLYTVVGDIQDAQNATQTYQASSSQMEDYLTDYRYTTGTVNPFVSSSSESDLPSETVSTSTTGSDTTQKSTVDTQEETSNTETNTEM